jgi:luciferase family oxidoreductase group 1
VPITLLGSSLFSAQLAAKVGLPFAFAAHFAPDYLTAAAHLYRETFRPSRTLREPHLMVALQVVVAETDAAAKRLFTTPQQRFLRLIRNQPVELLPPVDSMETLWQDWERSTVESKLRAAIVGSESTVKLGLENVVAETGADEVIAVTDTYEHADRLRSYEFLAEVAAMIKTRTGVGVGV